MKFQPALFSVFIPLIFSLLCGLELLHAQNPKIRVGAVAVDVSPPEFPVIQNGGFLENRLNTLADPLHARALVIDEGNNENAIAIVVVDSCMIPQTICDKAKALANVRTGIAPDRMLISATHTHSAPSVMNHCLGSRKDPKYTEFLPGKIAEAIAGAYERRQPAQVGWTTFDAGAYTANRRWITRPDILFPDPFGEKTVRAMMHPGYANPDYISVSGPTDPSFTLLSFQTTDGKPLAVLGNFSMHYFSGHQGVSADYFGQFCRELSERIASGDSDFVAIQSQGTSGDLWRADYGRSKPDKDITLTNYVSQLADFASAALKKIEYQSSVPLKIAEKRLTIPRRVPDKKRLAWARDTVGEFKGRQPANRPEVYARQAIYLHENPTDEVTLQAVRIGDFAITAMPNEVYALTGLKLKARSPLTTTMNITLANGATGYIPPPEQHDLGGYTTWPARTAGLEKHAEPQIVDEVLTLLESVSDKERQTDSEPEGVYAKTVRSQNPRAYFTMADMERGGRFESEIAFYLPGVDGKGFADKNASRSVFFAGGRMPVQTANEIADYSVSMWLWNALPVHARPVTGYLFSRGDPANPDVDGDHFGIGGRHAAAGRLFVYNGNGNANLLAGHTVLPVNTWNHVALVRRGTQVSVYLNGALETSGSIPITHHNTKKMFFGGRSDNFANLQGKLDEVALFNRALTKQEIEAQFAAAGREPVVLPPDPLPLNPVDTIAATSISRGFRMEIVAAEPLVMDPVAIDWSLDGKCWIAEMADYAVNDGEKGVNRGRIVYLSDSNGDGHYDRRQVFLKEVSSPVAVMAWRNGVLVAAASEIFYAEDSDGDGHADVRNTWLSGFVEGNQQLRANGLRWGLDNWIYCASGGHHAGFGVDTKITVHRTGKTVRLGSRDFRFREDGGFEAVAGPSQFGRVRDDFGNWFGVQNARPLWHYVIEDRYLNRNPAVPSPDPRQPLRDHMARIFPAKQPQYRFHGFDHAGHYTSACGISIYRDRSLFPDAGPDSRTAFTCAPFHNLVQRHDLTSTGSTFAGRRANDGSTDFVASADRWFRPVMTRTGPEGGIWIVDFYRYMVEHPEWLPPTGKAALKPHYRSGDDRGRIYRVISTNNHASAVFRVGKSGLHDLLQSPNGIVRDLAHRHLVQRRDASGLAGIAANHKLPEVRIQALSALSGMGKLPENSVRAALEDQHPAVRRHAVRLAENHPGLAGKLVEMATDNDSSVRFQLALSLGEFKSADAGKALVQIAQQDNADPWFAAAIASSAAPHIASFQLDKIKNLHLLSKLIHMIEPGSEQAKQFVSTLLPDAKGNLGTGQLRLLAAWKQRIDKAANDLNPSLAAAERIVRSPDGNAEHKVAAIRVLDSNPKLLSDLLTPQSGADIQAAVLDTLCSRRNAETFRLLAGKWDILSPARRQQLIRAFLSQQTTKSQLIALVESKVIPATEVDAASRQRLLLDEKPEIREQARKVFSTSADQDLAKIIETLRPALTLKGNTQTGAKHFAERCAVCHQIGGDQRSIGPNLKSITDHSPAALLTAVIDPNRSVEPSYLAYIAELNDGETVYGLIAAETANSVVFFLPDGTERSVLRKNIGKLSGTGLSFMPNGLEQGLRPQDVADLLAYIQEQL